MSQPVWKLVANLGDVNPLDHGGFFVYVDETGVYPPEAEVLEVNENGFDDEDDDKGEWVVHRFILEPCTYINGILSDNKFHPECPAWFADDIKSLATFVDMEVEELIRLFCSNAPLEQAVAWRAVGDYWGCYELDHYPLTFTSRSELKARYPD